MDPARFVTSGIAVSHVAPAVKLMRGRNRCWLHSGIVYRSEAGQLRIVHFGWDRDLDDDPYEPGYYCSLLPQAISDGELKWLAAYCEGLATAGDNADAIPYGIKPDHDAGFDPDTKKWKPTDHESCLTCATFVLAVFRSANCPLADSQAWPVRGEDTPVQQRHVDQLKSRSSTLDQGLSQEQHVGRVPRIRPEEVVGAPLEDSLPACFQQCESNGRWVLRQIEFRDSLPPNTLSPN